jgi:hypothetical protein
VRVPEREHRRELRQKAKPPAELLAEGANPELLNCSNSGGNSWFLHHLLNPLDLAEQSFLYFFGSALTTCDAANIGAVDPELLRDSRVDPSVKLVSIEHVICASIFPVTIVAHAHSGI